MFSLHSLSDCSVEVEINTMTSHISNKQILHEGTETNVITQKVHVKDLYRFWMYFLLYSKHSEKKP